MSQIRGRPFPPGNRFGRGRPKGSRNKRSAQALQILDQYSESLIKKCIAKGLEGDTRALALCMERLLPALREPGVRLKLPKLNQLQDVNLAQQRVLQAIANGNITPVEGQTIASVLENHGKTLEGQEMEDRITKLEKLLREQHLREKERRLTDDSIRQKRSTAAPEPAGTQTGDPK
jgi:hypothetical protein